MAKLKPRPPCRRRLNCIESTLASDLRARREGSAIARSGARDSGNSADAEGLELSRTAVEQSPDAIILAGLDGRIRLWNAGAEAIFGFHDAEVIGQTLDVIISEDLRAARWAGFARAMSEGRTKYLRQPLTTRANHKAGT